MQHTGANICHVYLNGSQLQRVHKADSSFSAALDRDRNDTAGAVGQILLCHFVIGVVRQVGVGDRGDFVRLFQHFCHCHSVFAVLLHTYRQSFQSQIQQERGVCRRITAEVPHQLHSRLDDVCHFAELSGVDYTVIAFVRFCEVGEFAAFSPVKCAAVYNNAAALESVTVHVLGGGVDHNICSEFNGTAEDRRGKGVVHDQRDLVGMGDLGELFNVEYCQCRIGNGFAEDQLGVGLYRLRNGFFICQRVYPDALDAEPLQRYAEQVHSAAVNGGNGNNAVAGTAQIQHRQQGSCLSAGSEHCPDAALQCIAGGVGETGIHRFRGHVKQFRHLFGGVETISGALYNGYCAGAAVFRGIAGVQAFGFQFCIRIAGLHKNSSRVSAVHGQDCPKLCTASCIFIIKKMILL